jgi:hypothetical protein
MFIGALHVLLDIALRIDNGCDAGIFIADQIRRVREAIEIELFDEHSYIRSNSAATPCPPPTHIVTTP